MASQICDIDTARGVMPVHVSLPDSAGPSPLVVIYMDSLGIRDVLHDHAHRLNDAGYVTALPDLFFDVPLEERPRIERLKAGNEEEFRRMADLVARLDDQAILEGTERLVAALGPTERWACVGFCMGARFALRSAETFAAEVGAAALLHPSRVVTGEPDSPHLAADRMRAALYLGVGENDHVAPPASLAPLREQLDAHAIPYRFDVLPHADHGFTMAGMPAYNHEAAERAWAGTLQLLGERF